MCSRIIYLLLASLFVYLTVTVAAFVYLEWWQAILASGVSFILIIIGLKHLFKSMIQSTIGSGMKGLFDVKSKVLRNASVDVHAVKSVAPPAEVLEQADDPDLTEFDRAEAAADLKNLRWYEIEASIFPDPSQGGPMYGWDLADLSLVPAGSPEPKMFDPTADDEDVPEIVMRDVRLVQDGEAVEPDGPKVHGTLRLRFVAGVPREVRELTFRYYFEQFGRIKLTAGPALLG